MLVLAEDVFHSTLGKGRHHKNIPHNLRYPVVGYGLHYGKVHDHGLKYRAVHDLLAVSSYRLCSCSLVAMRANCRIILVLCDRARLHGTGYFYLLYGFYAHLFGVFRDCMSAKRACFRLMFYCLVRRGILVKRVPSMTRLSTRILSGRLPK